MALRANPTANELVAFLRRNDQEYKELGWYWHGNLNNWGPDEMEDIRRAVDDNTSIRKLQVWVTAAIDEAAAHKLVSVLMRFLHITEFLVDYDDETEQVSAEVVDMLFRGMTVSPAPLTHLATSVCGSGQALREFMEHFGHIVDLQLGYRFTRCVLSQTVALSLAPFLNGRPNLQKLLLFPCPEPENNVSWILILVAVGVSRSLQTLVLETPSDAATLLEQLYIVGAVSKSINYLGIRHCGVDGLDVSPFLLGHKTPLSSSIQKLEFEGCVLPGADAWTVHPKVFDGITNLVLKGCIFRGLSQNGHHHRSLLAFLDDFPCLKTLHFLAPRPFDDAPVSGPVVGLTTYDDIETLAQTLRLHPTVNDVSLDLVKIKDFPTRVRHAIDSLMRECKGRLHLHFHRIDTTPLIDNGLRALGNDLKHVEFSFHGCDIGHVDFLRYFQVLQTNATLESLAMDMNNVEDPMDMNNNEDRKGTISGALNRLLRTNQSLQTLKLANVSSQALLGDGLDNNEPHRGILDQVIDGLEHNGSLRVLHIGNPTVLSNGNLEALVRVANLNGVLHALSGMGFPSGNPLVDQLKFLFKQNRLGRRFLLHADGNPPRGFLKWVEANEAAALAPNLPIVNDVNTDLAPRGFFPVILANAVKKKAHDVVYQFLRA